MSKSISGNSVNQTPISDGKVDRLERSVRRALTPRPRISIPEWADRKRFLAREAGSNSGRWRTSTVEIARGPMLAATEPGTHVITAMSCTQLLKTSLLENVFGFHADMDPCPMLLVQPKDDAAEQFSKERITPLIKATPALRDIVGTGRTRAADETLTYKAFPGGFLALVGAGSPDNLARRPVRIVLYDEVDKYPITREGDPITLGDERLATFGVNCLSIRACSPTVEDESRIESSYAESDQRRASLECPHCGHRMFPDFFKHVEWERTEDGRHQPETARIYCESCGAGWSEGERLRALATVRWHQTRPFHCCGRNHSPLDEYEAAWRDGVKDPVSQVWDWWEGKRWAVYRAKCPDCGVWPVSNEHAGFQASKMFSPWQKDRPADIAKKWLAAGADEDKKQSWWNTQMGLPYRPKIGKDLQPSVLMERREVWPGDVPAGAALLTAGVDTQADRIEVEVVAWGRGEESWSVAYEIFEGDPDQPEVWALLDAFLQRQWLRADGRVFTIAATCVDSGGANTQAVYRFCRPLRLRRVWAIKGASEGPGQRNPVWPSRIHVRKGSRDYRPVIIGTNAAKDSISGRLQVEQAGPGCMHFPADRDANYFAQLTGERLVLKKRGGKQYRVWEAKRNQAHEALDCRVYAYAALWGLMVNHKIDPDREADKVGAADEAPIIRAGTPEAQRIEATKGQAITPKPSEKKTTRRRKVSRSSFMGG